MQPTEQAPGNRPGLGAIATWAGLASGAITAVGALGAGLLFGELVLARRTIPGAEAPPPRSSGRYGDEYAGASELRVAVLGDSTAAGYGVATRAETPGALLATWISDAARRPVRLTCPAVVGSPSAWLPGQVETAVAAGVDLAIVIIGANDVTSGATSGAGAAKAVGHLADAVGALRASGAEVVVATCPDLGTIRPIRPPLRWLARRWSRQLAAAQTVAVVRAGGRTVSLGDLLGPEFDAAPDRMFGSDRYHPSAEGYAAACGVILPAVLSALGLAPAAPETPAGSLVEVAAMAAEAPGMEVIGAETSAPVPAKQARWWAPLRRDLGGERLADARTGRLRVPSVGTE
jgi:lysophospholipase L1-like esterase